MVLPLASVIASKFFDRCFAVKAGYGLALFLPEESLNGELLSRLITNCILCYLRRYECTQLRPL